MGEVASIQLFRQMQEAEEASTPGLMAEDLPAVAFTAAVLAHVVDEPQREVRLVARLIGPATPEDPSTALLKPLRFRRLMEAAATDGIWTDELLTAFRRLMALAGGSLPVQDLSDSLLEWCNGWYGENRRRRWIYDYWDAGPPPVHCTTIATSITEGSRG